ncbi:uncharacterized protein B0H18DRAFT_1116515 [Fomitopsis serialis]|uniref:uncharacterized protein n=1 Tax=Fomitopsis serialis TaxID=139415 RepID=UPI002008C127|nr:uncharacterized protein B0H18DRAFT_1116515 [Neoantrodia serialis]KAH9931359.1 hypothetical protein B0H18DRAFT_1116515 [Neoantrodia serialis]
MGKTTRRPLMPPSESDSYNSARIVTCRLSKDTSAQLYSDIATILTAGQGESAKRDGRGAATRAVSVTGATSQTHGAVIAVAYDSEDRPSVATHPPPPGGNRLCTRAISLSDLDRAASHIQTPDAPGDLLDNVLAVSRALSLPIADFIRFIVHCCIPKILHRYNVAEKFWTAPLSAILQLGWEPQPQDELGDGRWFPLAPHLAEELSLIDPCPVRIRTSRDGRGEEEWFCDAAAAASWVELIRKVLNRTREELEDARTAGTGDQVTEWATSRAAILHALLSNTGTRYLSTAPSL